jgi:integrase/recombinase XerD
VRDISPLADILSRYEKHLLSERGLVITTALRYQHFIRKFLVERFQEEPFLFREVKPSDISNFVLRHGPSMSVGRAQQMTTAFRSFLQYLFQKGELHADLATVADWRLSTVPKYLTLEEVDRVPKACNRRTATGRRDYAILLLLARFGLRASEVVALQLDDINWRAGELVVRGKGCFTTGCPCLGMWARHQRPICVEIVLPAERGAYLYA